MNIHDAKALDLLIDILSPQELRGAMKAEAIAALCEDEIGYASQVLSRLADILNARGGYDTKSYTNLSGCAGQESMFETYLHDFNGKNGNRPE